MAGDPERPPIIDDMLPLARTGALAVSVIALLEIALADLPPEEAAGLAFWFVIAILPLSIAAGLAALHDRFHGFILVRPAVYFGDAVGLIAFYAGLGDLAGRIGLGSLANWLLVAAIVVLILIFFLAGVHDRRRRRRAASEEAGGLPP